MNFSDFQPKELIGKQVHITNRYNQSIKTIVSVTKTGFKVNDSESIYKLPSGYLRRGDPWYYTTAELISDERAAEIKAEWAAKKLRNESIDTITNSLQSLSIEQLTKILLIIKP